MQKPLADFFEDLTPDQRRRVLELVESLPEDVKSVVFPKTSLVSVSDSVGTPLATYQVDIEAFNVLKNVSNLHLT